MAKPTTPSTPPATPKAPKSPPKPLDTKLAKQQAALSAKLESANKAYTEQNRETKKLTTRTTKLYEKEELVTKALHGVEKSAKKLDKKMDNTATAFDQSSGEILDVAIKHEDLGKKMDKVITGYDLMIQAMKNSKYGPVLTYTGRITQKTDPVVRNMLIQIARRQKESLVQLRIIARRAGGVGRNPSAGGTPGASASGASAGSVGPSGQPQSSNLGGSLGSTTGPGVRNKIPTPALDRKREKARIKAEETAGLEEEIENMSNSERRELLLKQKTERQLRARAEASVGYNRSMFQRMGNRLKARWEESDSRIVRGGAASLLATGRGVAKTADFLTDAPVAKQIKQGVRYFRAEKNRRKDEKREVFVKEKLNELRESNTLTEVHKREKAAAAARAANPTVIDKMRNKMLSLQVNGQLSMIDVLNKINRNLQMSAVMGAMTRIGGSISTAVAAAIPMITGAITAALAGGKAAIATVGAGAAAAGGAIKSVLGGQGGTQPPTPPTGGQSNRPPPRQPPNVGAPSGKGGGYSRRQRQQLNQRGTRHAMGQSASAPKINRVPAATRTPKPKISIFKRLSTILTKRVAGGLARRAPLAALGIPGAVIAAGLTASDVAMAAYDTWDLFKDLQDEKDAELVANAQQNLSTPSDLAKLESSEAGQLTGAIQAIDSKSITPSTPTSVQTTESVQTGVQEVVVPVSNSINNMTTNNYSGSPFSFDNSSYQTNDNKGSMITR